ncbi:NUDIX hydrolase [Caballeronia hypogeia]|uniref:NUDIX hydrolase n=1 Tax=Caballeronia hypogeia TaxID=1777140 RepID=A0A158CDL0_9BURK|nr:NUDIX domain-containing protein [Caballeronia hypogeia]SAK80415.1 NUDIX hydrolase [Caballeronia hypogeia]
MRIRATVLVIRQQAVLLVRERGGPWLLPGETVEPDELTMVVAIRALYEGTGVEANAAAFLFQQVSAHHLHHVFRIAIPDDLHPRAAFGSGLDDLCWVDASQLANVHTTPGTRSILNRALGVSHDTTKSTWRENGARVGIGKRWRGTP